MEDKNNKKLKTKKEIMEYLEEMRQKQFAEENSKESVFTREFNSIIDPDN